MNQAYFTFCCSGEGKSLSGLGGDRTRAADKGTSESELTNYRPYCSYPRYSGPINTDPSYSKLVYAKIENEKNNPHFLAHSVYALPDKETNREGNYFCHLIYHLPNSWNVKKALEMWRSPFWVTQDSDEITPELPPITKNIASGIINDYSFVEFLRSSPERLNKFLFLLKARLTSNPKEKIVLTGVPEDAAFCLWGITRILPPSMWDNLTFSTHEKPTPSFAYDVVNFPAIDHQDEYIISELSQYSNVLLYSEDNVQQIVSDLPNIPFADTILEVTLNGQFQTLDDFYKRVPERLQNSVEMLQLFWTFIHNPKKISNKDLNKALNVPELKKKALDIIMDKTRFSLDEQLNFYHVMDSLQQDVLLNRLISENSIEKIRRNQRYSKLLVSALSISEEPKEPKAPEKKPSLLQWLFRK